MEHGKSKKVDKNPRESANIFSLITFWYTKDLVKKGLGKDFEEKDLYEVINKFESKYCGDRFEKQWTKEMKTANSPSLFKTLTKIYGFKYLLYGTTMLIFELMKRIVEPYAITNLVSYFQPGQTNLTKFDAYVNAAILLISNFSQIIYFYNFDLFLLLLGLEVRTSLCSALFRKAVRLSPGAVSNANMGNIVTLITKDVQQFRRTMFIFNDIWVLGSISIVVCYILYSKIGPISLIAAGIYVCLIPLEAFLGKLIHKLRKQTCQKTDERIQLTQEILSASKIIKIYSWEEFFYEKINLLRKHEISKMLLIFYLKTILMLIGSIASKAGLYMLIMGYIWMDQPPEASIIFFITAHFETLTLFFGYLVPELIAKYSELIATLTRIKKVLTAEEVEKKTVPSQPSSKSSVELKNVTIKIKNDEAVLSNVNFKADSGLTIITGRVGCGKSTLLKAILQEYSLKSGEIICNGSFSFASQDPWCFPSTIKENILFGEGFDEKRYNDVLRACALEYDLSLFEKGDETVLTDKGQNLSKGQQARINLARAAYKESDIYLLDDCLSALDTHVHNFVFNECIKKFLKDKIRILINQTDKNLKDADKVVVMSKGRIIYSYNPQRKIDVVEEVTEEFLNMEKKDFETEPEINKLIETEQTTYKHIYEEELKKGAVDRIIYKKYVAFGGGLLLLMFVLSFVGFQQAAESYSQKLIAIWSDQKQNILNIKANITKENYNTSMQYDIKNAEHEASSTFEIYTIMLVAAIFLEIIKTYSFLSFCRRASIKIHKVMLQNVLQAVMTFSDTHFIGNILNRFSQDINNVDENLPFQLFRFLETVIHVGGAVFLIVTVNPYFIIYVLITLGVLMSFLKFYLPVARNLQRLEASTRSPMIGHLNAALEGLTTIRAYKAEHIVIDEFEKHQNVFTSAHHTTLCFQYAFGFYTNALASVMVLMVISTFIIFDTEVTAGSVGLALTQVITLGNILQGSVKSWADLENSMTAAERALEYSELKTESKQGAIPKHWPSKGVITYDKVSLSHNNNVILRNLNFKIDSRKKIGIVGRTGAGKSSIISTIFRLYEVEGDIRIDGVDIRTLPLKYLRNNLAIIPQDPILFSGTVRSNLDPYGEFKDEDIWAALDKANSKGFIKNLDSTISSNASDYSLGQKQMVCLARAILSKAKIVILDEATANMDYETDILIQDAIKRNFADCTVLSIAHKLQCVLNCDFVMVLDRGEIVEFDSPRVLLEDSSSVFWKMFQQNVNVGS